GTSADGQGSVVIAEHPYMWRYVLACDGAPDLLFTENDTNLARLYGAPNASPYVKDGINDAVVHGRVEAVNPASVGTKAAAHYHMTIGSGETATIRLRLTTDDGRWTLRPRSGQAMDDGEKRSIVYPFADFDTIFTARQAEADAFYDALQPATLD